MPANKVRKDTPRPKGVQGRTRKPASAPPRLGAGSVRAPPRRMTKEVNPMLPMPLARRERTMRVTRDVKAKLTTGGAAAAAADPTLRVKRTIVEGYDGRGRLVRHEFSASRSPAEAGRKLEVAKRQKLEMNRPAPSAYGPPSSKPGGGAFKPKN